MDATRYKPIVNWRTWVRNVVQVDSATETDPAVFQCSVKPIDLNDAGADIDLAGLTDLTPYILIDYVGHIYQLGAIAGTNGDNSVNVLVSDVFRTGECPQNCQQGVVAKKAWNGRSVLISPVILSHLHHSAKAYIDSLNWDILWSNDPNPIRIEFTNTATPSILTYQEDQEINDKTVNLAKDYGENPKVKLFFVEDNIQYEQFTPCIRTLNEDELIDSIAYDLGEERTGFIEISR